MADTTEELVQEPVKTEEAPTPAPQAIPALVLITNFFTGIAKILPDKINLTLTIARKGNIMTVGVRPQVTDGDEDNDDLKIRPLVLNHPAEDLDKGFFETVSTGVAKFRTFAEELGAFEDGLKKTEKKTVVKVAPSQAAASNSSGKKKKKPAPKPGQKKPVKPTPAPKPPEPTPQERAAAIVKPVEKLASDGKYDEAIKTLGAALKVYNDPAYQGEIKKLEVLKFRRDIEPEYAKLDGLYAAANYGDLAKRVKEIVAKDPDNPKIGEIKGKLTKTLGEGFVKQLIG